MAETTDHEINRLIQDVVEAAKLPPRARQIDIKPTVADLISLGHDRGFLPDALESMIDVLTVPSHLDQASLSSIARNLYPATAPSRMVVLRVVSCLGHGQRKPSLNIQAALVRWLILVYPTLQSPSTLSQCYQVLFQLLDTAAFRPQVSQLLALITRRKHVRPFRIQALLSLSRQSGSDPCLVGLLRVFKDYYPEIIVGEAVRGKASAFKHPDPQWRQRLDEIQEAHAVRTLDGQSQIRDGFRVHRPINRFRRNKLIPLVQTSRAPEDAMTLEEVESVNNLAQNIEKIELPNQLVAVLADPLLQKVLLLRPSEESNRRVFQWLDALLDDIFSGDADHDSLWEVLEVLSSYVTLTKSLSNNILNFLARYLPVWDGTGPHEAILNILSHIDVLEFSHLEKHIFQPLESSMLDLDISLQGQLLGMYGRLLRHWTAILKASETVPEHASDSVSRLVKHANSLAFMVVQTVPTIATASAILEFFEHSVNLVTDEKLRFLIRIELPEELLVYMLFLSSSLPVVSRICGILARLKRGFETAMATKPISNGQTRIDSQTYNRSYVNRYNGFLMDICNCFWRFRAFATGDPNAQGCLIPRPTVAALASYVLRIDRSLSLAMLFSLSYSPLLCQQSILNIRKIEDETLANGQSIRSRHAGPATQTSLNKLAVGGGIQLSWQEYRIGVLESLAGNNLPGIADLLKNTMTVLKNSMEGRPSGNATMVQQQ